MNLLWLKIILYSEICPYSAGILFVSLRLSVFSGSRQTVSLCSCGNFSLTVSAGYIVSQ